MSIERLEEVIELMCESYHDYLVADNIKRSEVRYKSYLDCKEIIKSEFEKQAERVQSLEYYKKDWMLVVEQNKRYREVLEEILAESYEEAGLHPDTNMQLETFIAKIARKALESEDE